MSCIKRYLDHLYYDKICKKSYDELIEEGMTPEEIECVRNIFENEESQ